MSAGPAGKQVAPMRVTVVMPARNVAEHVDETLDSVFAQTRIPDEIVVADGCSTDETVERVLRHADRGVPLRVVRNESIFCGGGRNAATHDATYDLLVTMDFANRADPKWLEEMVRCFEEDPALDLLAGMHDPIADTPFQRVCAAVVYYLDYLVPAMRPEEIRSHISPNFTAGGMCMAYRRAIWERAGGFSEWARKGQDGLFGHRVRRLGGKVGFTLDAMIHYETPRTLRELFDRRFLSVLWSARMGQPRASWSRHVLPRAFGVGLLAATVVYPVLFVPVAVVALAYAERGAWCKLRSIRSRRGVRFRWRDWTLSVLVLLVRDTATVGGELLGSLDGLVGPEWRSRAKAYLELGAK